MTAVIGAVEGRVGGGQLSCQLLLQSVVGSLLEVCHAFHLAMACQGVVDVVARTRSRFFISVGRSTCVFPVRVFGFAVCNLQ